MKKRNLYITLIWVMATPIMLFAQDAKLEVEDGAVLFRGTTGSTPVSGAGTRMMWTPNKAAFRAGIVSGAQWDAGNIGSQSFAIGINNTASGYSSFASGVNNTASDYSSFASGVSDTASGYSSFVGGGENNTASGYWSFVGGGKSNVASGNSSFASGSNNTTSGYSSFIGGGENNIASKTLSFVGGGNDNMASGFNSFVGGGGNNTASGTRSFVGGGSGNTASGDQSFVGAGTGLLAKSFGEAVFGTFNTDYTPASATSFSATDRLFVIGNGTAINSRSNAVAVMKNGRVGIGNAASTPGYLLDVAGTLNLNKSISSGIALRVNETEALWYDGTYFSWGFGGEYNRFADPLRIGSAAVPTHTLEVDGTAAKTDGGSWSMLSDARLKTVNGPYVKGLEAIGSLKPIRFNYNNDNPHQLDAETEQIGFIAQEVQPIFPEAVTMLKDGYLSFNMHSINVALVNAVKELKEENDILKAEVTLLNKCLITEMESLQRMEGQLAQITSALTKLGVNLDPVP